MKLDSFSKRKVRCRGLELEIRSLFEGDKVRQKEVAGFMRIQSIKNLGNFIFSCNDELRMDTTVKKKKSVTVIKPEHFGYQYRNLSEEIDELIYK